ncbi:FAD-binding oxidoreductase [Lewinella sp. W8]|uniref:NAD(P)/FAD-dependent oxidoreductase n=1 Tax=Lewinella sp. W8 TaxID=2528208 RepID=UPI00106780D4|nr:FAD-dependent oxidoreductase [Lewinella sp. W8]MTB49988.1 FAD-dependent oxidoreductase [Lewinella sp. W8]
MHFLIVGQGLAGTLLGYRLERAGHRVEYVDAPGQTAASSVAAGIINPITGRRFVKSWRIDELIPAARELYRELEALLDVSLWHELPLIRTLYNRGDENDWLARTADPGYADYMEEKPKVGRIPSLTEDVHAYAGVRHAARVDIGVLVTAYRERLQREGRLREETFDYQKLEAGSGDAAGARYYPAGQEVPITYDTVIFCEGWRARFNPWFGALPHGGNKGEVLLVKTEAPLLERMFKHRVFLVPFTEDTYWIGATSENQFSEENPTAVNRQFLEDRLREVLTVPYEIVEHRAAVRPTVRDRRPFLGRHPQLPALAIFNGLGTKGTSLAPLCSRWLADHLLTDAALPPEVDIRRWEQP